MTEKREPYGPPVTLDPSAPDAPGALLLGPLGCPECGATMAFTTGEDRMSVSFPNDNCRNCKIWQDWKAKAEQVQDERDVLLAACEMVPRLLKEIRGFASDVFGGESSLTDCIDLVLSETEIAIAKTRGQYVKTG